jgi:hypothetical protein
MIASLIGTATFDNGMMSLITRPWTSVGRRAEPLSDAIATALQLFRDRPHLSRG